MSALALALVAAASVQAPPPTFAVDVEAVYVDVFVTEANRPVTGLTEADFEVRDNGARQQVELVAVESLPLTTFLVLDTSGSVEGEKLVQLQAAARALLAGLRPGDEASLVTFDQEIQRARAPHDRPCAAATRRGRNPARWLHRSARLPLRRGDARVGPRTLAARALHATARTT